MRDTVETAEIRNPFGRADYLKSLRHLIVDPAKPVAKRDVQRAVVQQAYAMTSPVCDEALEALYVNVLTHLKVRCYETTEIASDPPPEMSPGWTVIPQYETQWRHVEHRPEVRSGGLTRLLHEVANALIESGFSRSFARVYVTDDMETTRERLSLPDIGGDAVMALCFPYGESGVEIPILLVQYTELPVPLHACLLHEIMHLVVYYLWRLRPPSFVQLAPLPSLATALATEVFAHMQTAMLLGESYLVSTLVVEDLALATSRMATKADESGELSPQRMNEAKIFLDSFPFVAAAWALRTPAPDLVQAYQQLWPEDLRRLAAELKPVCLELFDSADFTGLLYSRFLALLGSEGPTGDLFERVVLDLL